MKKQFLCLLLVLAALLVLGITPAMADAPAATPITLGGSARAVIANGGDIAYFSFTPNETVNCSFYSTGNSDTYGYIYDANMTRLASNDDSGEGSNFNVNYQLEAGNTYYFGAKYYSSSNTGEFEVFLDYAHFLELKAENDETSIFVSYGEGATLRTTVESYPEGEISYQWDQYTDEYNYNTLYGETGSSLTIDSVTDQLHFRCTARNDEFSSSVHFYVSVENHLTVQAVGDTELTVEGGKGVTLRVSASADHGDLQYSWQKRAYEKGYYGSWQTIEGATGNTYIESPAVRADYRCTVTDQYNSSQTIEFSVSVDNALTLTRNNVDSYGYFYVAPNEPALLEVNGSCLSGSITYTWYKGWSTTIEGATGTSYTTEPITGSQTYRCMAEDEYGNSVEVAFYCRVDNQLTLEADGSTDIYVQPGSAATLKVKAACKAGELTYKWYDSNYNKLSEGSSTFITDALNAYTTFSCSVGDEYGNSRSIYFHCYIDNRLSVEADGPTQLTLRLGDSATLKVNASCSVGELSYVWYQDSTYPATNRLPGEVGPTLNTGALDGYKRFICVVTDQYGNSKTVYFYCSIANDLSVGPAGPRNYTVAPGESVTLTVDASCRVGDITYEWNGYVQDPSTGYSTNMEIDCTEASCTLTNVQKSCRINATAIDVYGNNATTYFEIEVDNRLKAGAEDGFVTVAPGETAVLAVAASCHTGDLFYQWYRLNYLSNNSYTQQRLQGQSEAILTLPDVTEAGDYRCEVYDQYGSERGVDFTVSLDNGFSVVAAGNTAFTVAPKGSVTAKVAAGCKTGSVSYEWYFRRNNDSSYYSEVLQEGSGATFTMRSVEYSGTLTCYAKDGYGNKGSVAFQVTVDNELKASHSGNATLQVAKGGSATLSVSGSCKTGDVHFQWERGIPYGASSYSLVSIDGANDSSYSLTNLQKAGRYACMVYDDYGNSVRLSFYIEIINEFTASTTSKTFVWLRNGATATLRINASSTAGAVSYQWYEADFAISGETGSSLTVGDKYSGQNYVCTVMDQYGNSRSFPFYCIYDAADPIAVDETKNAVISDRGGISLFSFTPSQTGVYRFHAVEANTYTAAYLLDADMNQISYVYSSPSKDFVLEETLIANRQYYLAARSTSLSYCGNFQVKLTKESASAEINLNLPLIKGQKVYLPSDLYGTAGSATAEGSCVTLGSKYLVTAIQAGEGKVTVNYGDMKVVYNITVENSGNVLKLPSALTEIQEQAFFGGDSVSYVELGSRMNNVGSQAFADSGLRQILVKGSSTRFADDALSGTAAVILCPRSSAAASFAINQGITYVYTN